MVKNFECEVAKKFKFGIPNFFMSVVEKNFLGLEWQKKLGGRLTKYFEG